jgi:integrase
VRGRIERVLDAAKVRGLRSGENPAVGRGHLALLLPKRQALQRGHHAAMPYRDLPPFVERLRLIEGVSAPALEFVILTAARSGEVRGARWSEINLESAVWIVPAERMKAGREHRVPLGQRALALLDEMGGLQHTGKPDDLVFPGLKAGSLAIDPKQQNSQLGRRLLGAAEDWIREKGGQRIKMTVIDERKTLLDWYERRGYSEPVRQSPFRRLTPGSAPDCTKPPI